MKKILVCTLFFILLSCTNDEEREPELLFKRKIDKLDMESFKIPDSINTALIIVSYYDPESDIHTLLVYNDGEKKSARKIDYLPDSTSLSERLEILKPNEFRSTHYTVDYIVNENTVSMIYIRKRYEIPLPQSKEFRRTDRD